MSREEGTTFPHAGLASNQSFGHKDNIAWHGGVPPAGDAPYIFTQELCGWATSVFCKKRCTHATTKADPAFQRLERLAAEHKLVEALGGAVDNANLGAILCSLQKSLAVVLSNHLMIATKAHTKLYLKEKYAHLYLTNLYLRPGGGAAGHDGGAERAVERVPHDETQRRDLRQAAASPRCKGDQTLRRGGHVP